MSDSQNEGCHSSVVEHCFGKAEVDGSIPSDSTIYPPEVAERFWKKVKPLLNGGADGKYCWEWRGAFRTDGYGQFKPFSRKNPVAAHRIAWELLHDRAVPNGMCILHSCDNSWCCNPWHLRPGTHKQNGEDKAKRGRTYKGGPRKLSDISQPNVT